MFVWCSYAPGALRFKVCNPCVSRHVVFHQLVMPLQQRIVCNAVELHSGTITVITRVPWPYS